MICRWLTCDDCSRSVAWGSAACSFCGAAREVTRLPSLDVGDPIRRWRVSEDGLPGWRVDTSMMSQEAESALLVLPQGARRTGRLEEGPRDGAIALRGRTLDAHGQLGVLTRMGKTGRVCTAYALAVFPSTRSFRVVRGMWDDRRNRSVDVLHDWELSTAVAPVGEWNVLEFRFADSLLEVRLNGVRATTVVDAALGFGVPGWRVAAEAGAARVELSGLELSALA